MTTRVVTKEMACNEAGTHNPHDAGNDYMCKACGSNFVAPTSAWECPCGSVVERFRGQDTLLCECGATYNSSGQRLRDDYMRNPSMYDDEIGDLEGYEMMYAGDY